MTCRSKIVICALGLTLGVACSTDPAVPAALELNDFHYATLTSLGLMAEPVAPDALLIRDQAGDVVGEAWTPGEGRAELAWGTIHVTVVEDADRTTMTCDDIPFVMLRSTSGEWVPDTTTPISAVPAACHEPITVARVVAAASRPMLSEGSGSVAVDDAEIAGSTQALCGGACYTQWGGTAASACNAAHDDCFSGAGGGVDFCQQSGNASCGSFYCTCTFCDPCQDFAIEAALEY